MSDVSILAYLAAYRAYEASCRASRAAGIRPTAADRRVAQKRLREAWEAVPKDEREGLMPPPE